MKNKLFVFVLTLGLLITSNVNAKVDFSKDYKYYEAVCSKKASYEINKDTCDDFEYFKSDKDGKVTQMTNSVKDSNLSADKLAKLIKKNNELIEKKTKELKRNKVKIAKNKARINKLERVVNKSLALMQHFQDENQMIDIVMGSTDIEDLMNRVDGLTNINRATLEDLSSLEKTSTSLNETRKYLKTDIKKLESTKKKQQKLYLEFQRKEADLYTKGNSGGNASYNSGLDSVDLNKIKSSDTFRRPTKSATITATTWYYPGGGWHPGADFALPVGNSILAPANGVLLGRSSSGGGYGNHIVAAFKKGDYVYTMLFAHMNGFVDGVTSFNKGDKIGISGNTGASTGPHIHIEVMQHNTDSLQTVVNQFKKNKDYWFGLGYNGKGDCSTVCRLEPTKVFNVKMGQKY